MTSELLRIHIIGAGLIGTSLALAAQTVGHEVSIEDRDEDREALAGDLLRLPDYGTASPHLVVVAVSPLQVASTVALALQRYKEAIVIDVASVKTKVLVDVECLTANVSRFIPTHPIAGREFGGPAHAQGDLFQGRPWILTPLPRNRSSDVERVALFIKGLGSGVHHMTPAQHDHLFARISHLPQIVSTLLSAQLSDNEDEIALAGQGLRDTTRLADSHGQLWSEILMLNAEMVLESLAVFKGSVTVLEDHIRKEDREGIERIFEAGNRGRQLLSGKHGGRPRDYVLFRIVIEDKPGILAELFTLCGRHSVNVEDLRIEHTPNQETGLITLAVMPRHSGALSKALLAENWSFHFEEPTK